MSFLTVSNGNIFFKSQGTRLGAIVAPNKGLEQALLIHQVCYIILIYILQMCEFLQAYLLVLVQQKIQQSPFNYFKILTDCLNYLYTDIKNICIFTKTGLQHMFSCAFFKNSWNSFSQNTYEQLFLNEFQEIQFYFKGFNYVLIQKVNCKSEKRFSKYEFEKQHVLSFIIDNQTKMKNLGSFPTFLGK